MSEKRGARRSTVEFHNCMYDWRLRQHLQQTHVAAHMGKSRFQVGDLEQAKPMMLIGRGYDIIKFGKACDTPEKEVNAFLELTGNTYDPKCAQCGQELRELSQRHVQEHLLPKCAVSLPAADTDTILDEVQALRDSMPPRDL